MESESGVDFSWVHASVIGLRGGACEESRGVLL